jgi:uncharacterized protein (DUF1330 family)
MVVGVNVVDQEAYAQYRAEMTPILESMGGGFRFDCEVSRVLKNEKGDAVNRLFVISFPDRAAKERFFSDPRYLEIRGRLFGMAVHGMIRLAEMEQ